MTRNGGMTRITGSRSNQREQCNTTGRVTARSSRPVARRNHAPEVSTLCPARGPKAMRYVIAEACSGRNVCATSQPASRSAR